MRSENEIRERLSVALHDKRLDKMTDCITNASLALVQRGLLAEVSALLWVLGEDGGSVDELRERFPLRSTARPTPRAADSPSASR